MVSRYEMLILTTPEITQDEMSELEKLFDKKVQEYKGKLISFDKWGKFQLAYPVRKNDYGVYFLVRFELSEQTAHVIKELRTLLGLKFNTCVMRYLVNQLAPDAVLEYRRPQSLEETPRDVEFVRDRRPSYAGPREQRFTREASPAVITEDVRPLSQEVDNGQES